MFQKMDGSTYSLDQLRRDNPNISFPSSFPDELIEQFGCRRVMIEPKPDYDPRTQKISQNAPTRIGGVWTITWSVANMTQAEQLAWHRDRYLDSDHFEFFLIESGLDDAFVFMIAQMKATNNKKMLARARAYLNQDTYNLGRMLDIVDRFKPVIATMPSPPGTGTVALIQAWDTAEAEDFS